MIETVTGGATESLNITFTVPDPITMVGSLSNTDTKEVGELSSLQLLLLVNVPIAFSTC